MLKSLKNIFASDKSLNIETENTEVDILSGLMIEAANTDGEITQEELNKISYSLINIFKEDPQDVEESLNKAFENKDNSRSLYYYTSKLNKSYSDEKKINLKTKTKNTKILNKNKKLADPDSPFAVLEKLL